MWFQTHILCDIRDVWSHFTDVMLLYDFIITFVFIRFLKWSMYACMIADIAYNGL